MTTRADMEAVIEAVLFVANDPVSRERLAGIFGDSEHDEAQQAVEGVVQRYLERPESGIVIDEVAGGLRLVSRPDLHDYLRKFFEVSSANKLSMPALETLAIVAYRQPVTAPEIQELRSVSSSGVLKTLLERRLVRIAGRKEVVGKPFLYATTREFLLHFGLRSLKELPPLEQFEEMFSENVGETEVDPEEEADREAVEIQESDEDAADEARREEEEWQREEEETRQLAQEADEAPSEKTSSEEEQPDENSDRAEIVDPDTDLDPGTDPDTTRAIDSSSEADSHDLPIEATDRDSAEDSADTHEEVSP